MSSPIDQEAIAFLEQLVRIESPSGQEEGVARATVETLSGWGLQSWIDDVGNAIGVIGAGSRTVMLLGHIDTVPGAVPVRRDGTLLYGRGAVDAKGPFAAFCVAAARAGELPDLRVVVVGAVEEEAATSAGAYHILDTHAPAHAVIIGEPSRWNRVTLGYKGRLLVDYGLERPVSHTAGQEPSACEVAVSYWEQVRAWADRYNQGKAGAFETVDPSLRRINSGGDGLSERAEMRIGLRLPLGVDIDRLAEQLQEKWSGDARVTLSGREQPFRAGKRNPLTSAFLASIRAEGQRAAFVTKTGTSDMNVIGPRWACPIVAYGPGDSAYDHTPEEQIDLREYLRAIRVLTAVLGRLADTLPAW